MIIVRDVFHAKYGKGEELAHLFTEFRALLPPSRTFRIMTDLSGTFFTIVTEMEVESLAAWERGNADIFGHPAFGEWFAHMTPLVDSGSREFYTLTS